MEPDLTDQFDAMLRTLDRYIGVTTACGFTDTARLLGMAKLDLQMRIHGIDDSEIQELARMLEAGLASRDGGGTKRNGAQDRRTPRSAGAPTRKPCAAGRKTPVRATMRLR